MPAFLVNALWITLGSLLARVVLLGLLSAAALGLRGMLRADHPAREELLDFAKNSPQKSISFLKSLEGYLFYGFVAVLVLLALSGAGV
jgi:hypothetical protein